MADPVTSGNDEKKSRYAIIVPSPKARINLGNWHSAGDHSKFGYKGVSIQSEDNLFADVVKSSCIQVRGSYAAHAKDWSQFSKDAMMLATSDNATVAADGLALMVGGAGQAASYVLDHGEALDP